MWDGKKVECWEVKEAKRWEMDFVITGSRKLIKVLYSI
jgi:hypothetical protein